MRKLVRSAGFDDSLDELRMSETLSYLRSRHEKSGEDAVNSGRTRLQAYSGTRPIDISAVIKKSMHNL